MALISQSEITLLKTYLVHDRHHFSDVASNQLIWQKQLHRAHIWNAFLDFDMLFSLMSHAKRITSMTHKFWVIIAKISSLNSCSWRSLAATDSKTISQLAIRQVFFSISNNSGLINGLSSMKTEFNTLLTQSWWQSSVTNIDG